MTATTLRIAIVGAGPSGFFLAEKLLSQSDRAVAVDLFERLPTPYGLVRFGVAPDHEKIKNVTRTFDRTAGRPGFRFFGNVDIGHSVPLDELRTHYHAVCFATGAQTDRRMNIPGEDLQGSHPATEFVAWYNGHPEYRGFVFDLSVERVAVVGVGNVAVDVARILSRTPEELAKTDIAPHALEALKQSKVREIYLLGRRGPAQAAFTNPEVKELGELEGADVACRPEEVALDPLSAAALALEEDAATRKKLDILTGFAGRTRSGKGRCLTLRFLVSPTELTGDAEGRVTGMVLARNRLVEGKGGSLRAEATGETETLPVGLVFRSVGYRGIEIPGLPFDEGSGTVPNSAGRVTDGGHPVPGLYVAGWIKRGPSGVIGTNKPDAGETADSLLADAAQGLLREPAHPAAAIEALIRSRQPELVTWQDWERINRQETEAGRVEGRPRTKLVTVEGLLAAARVGGRGPVG